MLLYPGLVESPPPGPELRPPPGPVDNPPPGPVLKPPPGPVDNPPPGPVLSPPPGPVDIPPPGPELMPPPGPVEAPPPGPVLNPPPGPVLNPPPGPVDRSRGHPVSFIDRRVRRPTDIRCESFRRQPATHWPRLVVIRAVPDPEGHVPLRERRQGSRSWRQCWHPARQPSRSAGRKPPWHHRSIHLAVPDL